MKVYRSEVDPQWNLPWLWYDFTESSPAGDVHFIITDTEAIRDQFNNYTGLKKMIINGNYTAVMLLSSMCQDI